MTKIDQSLLDQQYVSNKKIGYVQQGQRKALAVMYIQKILPEYTPRLRGRIQKAGLGLFLNTLPA